eukprot:CAMPEP_0179291512 /NCGR_PEP_ID=MMETSP0797-20121207/42375_1 /TAXON_ID=47934 /ORGANISM="Dinophysis acuminata, Strain DAEP01" /LENGTH=112 /DNA_ID=CAMNT_0021000589 /DNA_START=58 /DNA_END=392 /DNA_ORIENTATION=+
MSGSVPSIPAESARMPGPQPQRARPIAALGDPDGGRAALSTKDGKGFGSTSGRRPRRTRSETAAALVAALLAVIAVDCFVFRPGVQVDGPGGGGPWHGGLPSALGGADLFDA